MGGVVVWVVADQTVDGSESGTSFKQALYAMDCGFKLHDTMIFEKDNPVPYNHNRYDQCFEYMFVLSKGRPKTFNGIRVYTDGGGKVYARTGGTQLDKNQISRTRKVAEIRTIQETKLHKNIFSYVVGGGTTGHPAVFPIKLATDQIVTWSNEGDTVLDPFLGSGTTRIAAWEMNRNFVGFEIDKKYFDKQEERFLEYAAQTSLF